MANDMADDLLAGLKNNYYQRADGTIVKVYNAVLQYQGKPEVPLLYASIITEMRPQTDISHGEVIIPLITSELIKYKKIPKAVIENLRAKSSQPEASAQTQPLCTIPTDVSIAGTLAEDKGFKSPHRLVDICIDPTYP